MAPRANVRPLTIRSANSCKQEGQPFRLSQPHPVDALTPPTTVPGPSRQCPHARRLAHPAQLVACRGRRWRGAGVWIALGSRPSGAGRYAPCRGRPGGSTHVAGRPASPARHLRPRRCRRPAIAWPPSAANAAISSSWPRSSSGRSSSLMGSLRGRGLRGAGRSRRQPERPPWLSARQTGRQRSFY